jgi:shikimate dehydrogenase
MSGGFLIGLIGRGIGASRSPEMHEREGRALGLEVSYQLMDLSRTDLDLPVLLDAAEAAGFAGVNITHPCKQAVIDLLDELSPEAEAIGAVNFRGSTASVDVTLPLDEYRPASA